EFGAFTHDKPPVVPLDQRRAAEQQALLGAGEAEIVVTTGFTETPDFVHHFVPLIVIYRLFILFFKYGSDYLLTDVSISVTRQKSCSPRDAFRRQAVRWSGCGARGRICNSLPG